MKLITYYGLLEPKTVYRVVSQGGDVEGYTQHPGDMRWHRGGSVLYEIQDTGALSITHEDARAIVTAWGGQLDDLDYYEAEGIESLEGDLWGIPTAVQSETELAPAAMAPPPTAISPLPVSPAIEALFSPEEQEFLAAFEGGLLLVNGEAIEEHAEELAIAIEEAIEEVKPSLDLIGVMAVEPPPQQMARKDAMAALREIVDGLSDLGRAGMSWA